MQITIPITEKMKIWLEGIYTKICVYVKSEEELLKIYEKAKKSNLPCALVEDIGLTVFDKPTITCCAISPAKPEEIDKITKRLRLV